MATSAEDLEARVVLLGASNLTMGLATVLANARAVLGTGRLEVHAALGHGRSYGLPSRVLFRSLPPILGCGLWPALAASRTGPTYALVTDLGNDIAYGVEPPTILAWVEECVLRLQAAGARVVLTSLPRGRLRRLRDWEIVLTRQVIFPSSRLGPRRIRERIEEVDSGLAALARLRGLAWVEVRPEWYGLDPMHVRRRSRPACWQAAVSPWSGGAPAEPRCGSRLEGLHLLLRAPEHRWLFGIEQRADQPGPPLAGARVHLY